MFRSCLLPALAALLTLGTAPTVALGAQHPQGATPAEAANVAATAVQHADWTGFYAIARGAGLGGFEPLHPDLDAEVMAHLQPWALRRIEETNGVADDTGAICNLAGLFRHPTTIGRFYWLAVPGKVIMAHTAGLETAGVRRIHFIARHPRNLRATWLGHSIGRWEADTLVIDTVGFNDQSWLMSGMEPHTEALHVIEQVRLVDHGRLMEIATTVEDRKALTSPYRFTRYYARAEPEVPGVCNDEPGEQALWLDFRRNALATGIDPPGAGAGEQGQAK